jgi:hypothetical protein
MIDIVDVDKMYTEFKIPKGVKVKHTKNGKNIVIRRKPRIICAPNEELKEEHRRILREELSKVRLHECAYGFVHDRTICDNAMQHINSESILSVDMKDFFTNVTKEQVYQALVHRGFDREKSEYISKVCTRKGVLPQGAPTSPALSNIVAYEMDNKINKLCKEEGMKYTRYADDITLSAGNIEILLKAKPIIFSIINSFGWKVSGSKVHIVSRCNPEKPLEVTGVIISGDPINKRLFNQPNVNKKNVRLFESIIHHIECEIKAKTLITKEQLAERYKTIDSLTGYANFLCQTNEKYREYMNRVKAIRKALK